jgi:hypothetical protein
VAVKDKTYKFPKAMGTCADKLFKIRENKAIAKKALAVIEHEEKALKLHIIDNLPKSKASGIAGKLARVSVIIKEVPQVKDWKKFYAYVKKHGAFDLMQRRLSEGAIKDRWEDGKKIPGVESFKVVSVSMNKL